MVPKTSDYGFILIVPEDII